MVIPVICPADVRARALKDREVFAIGQDPGFGFHDIFRRQRPGIGLERRFDIMRFVGECGRRREKASSEGQYNKFDHFSLLVSARLISHDGLRARYRPNGE